MPKFRKHLDDFLKYGKGFWVYSPPSPAPKWLFEPRILSS
jgi:hypothetical protein